MSKLYKRGRYWWAEGRDSSGKRWRQSTRQTDRRAAERVRRRLDLERALPDQVPALSLGDALDMAWRELELRQVSDATLQSARAQSANLIRILGGHTDVHRLRLWDVERYLSERRAEPIGRAGRTVSDHTVAKELKRLRFALATCQRHGLYHGEPKSLWPPALRDYYQARQRWLTLAEYRALLRTVSPLRRDYLVAYVHLGVRHSELYRIGPENVDLQGRRVLVAGTKTARARRWIGLSADAYEVFDRRLEQGEVPFPVWHRQHMRRELAHWCARAGLEPVTANDLRRTFASWLCSAGVPEITTCQLMGHSGSEMVRRVYAQLSEEAARSAADKLPSVPPER